MMTQLTSVLTPESKVKVFTHNDLDGGGCGLVAKLAFPTADITYCGYDNINEKVEEFFMGKEHSKYDQIFITDISVNKKIEMLINGTHLKTKVKLLDHHATASHLNDNDWAFVSPSGILGKNSGTNMLYEYLQMNGFFKSDIYRDALTVFVEKVRRYDSWEWKEIYDDNEARDLNDLFWLYGLNKFIPTFYNRIVKLDICIVREGSWVGMFNETDQSILDVDHDKKVSYINKKDKQMFTGKLLGRNVGFVFAEQYISELGNELSDRHGELSYIAIIDMGAKRVSYRTVSDDIDLGKDVAGKFGGGGHSKASGSQIELEAVKLIVPIIFGGENLRKQLVSLVTGKGFFGKLGKLFDKLTKK